MSAVSPLIAKWVENKVKWKYVYSPLFKSRTLEANEMYMIAEYIYPEGTLIHAMFFFDSPMCGARMEANPNLDTTRTHTINRWAFGVPSPNVLEHVILPPQTAHGVYGLLVLKEWVWQDYLRLYVYNDDSIPHNFIAGGYTLAVLEKETGGT
jgi:hypothetical protein